MLRAPGVYEVWHLGAGRGVCEFGSGGKTLSPYPTTLIPLLPRPPATSPMKATGFRV